MRAESPNPPNHKQKSNLRPTLIVLGGVLLAVFVIAIITSISESRTKNAAPAPSSPIRTPTPDLRQLPFQDLIATSIRIPYDDLFRANERHVGKRVFYQAEIVQVIEAGPGSFQLRANVTEGSYFWDDVVLLRYSGTRLLDKDIIEFVGTVKGLITYKAVLGNEITIPDIEVIQTRIVTKAGDR